ncbi:MAG: cytochrome c biogenesis protein DipZ [bacterium]|nr:cytochrome c biogenesis protein DipZ [bacterium]
MLILIAFAFIAGIVTILSPCILPILPVVLSGSVSSGKRKPFGIMVGFILSFTIFTLLTSAIVKATGVSADALRIFSISVIGFLGLSLIIPKLQLLSEKLFTKFSRLSPNSSSKEGFWGGLIIGLSIGLVWTPCVGPILAAVISLSFTTSVTYATFLITLSYALGTAIPMIAIIYLGRSLFAKVPFLFKNLITIQKVFGVLMILTAILLATNLDRKLQQVLLEKFPSWGIGLTKIEENQLVKTQINNLQKNKGTADLKFDKPAPELIAGGEWFNSPPRSIESLKGSVVLVDFWTYTCINCIRTFPYLDAWHEKYKDKGLVIIGVHSPEFEFEKKPSNVQKAINDYKIRYPVMQDNDFATWSNYSNNYWPAKYLIDAQGNIQYTHFGEGDYDETEKEIQRLLLQRDETVKLPGIGNKNYIIESQTPEIYLGLSRLKALEVNELPELNKTINYSPKNVKTQKNTFDYSGNVSIAKEFANPKKNTKLRISYQSKKVFLVMRPSANQGAIKILLDDKIVTYDISGEKLVNGVVTIDQDRLYTLINTTNPQAHTLTIEFLDDNTEAFAFTFE